MSGVRGPATGSLRDIRTALMEVPREGAIDTAEGSAPVLSSDTQGAYDGGVTVYGDPRPLGVNGNVLSLEKSGGVRGEIGFSSDGTTILRAVLSEDYAKYLIGKYSILPCGAQRLPDAWLDGIDRVAMERLDAAWERAKARVGL